MEKICGLPPIIDANSKILILGSFPSPLSLKYQRYYGNPQNHFWPILAHLLQEKFPASYDEKTKMALKHGVALWDVIKTCYRQGAADADIEEPEVNELESFVREHNHLRAVFFDGRTAEKIFKMYYEEFPLPGEYLPSTSSAHAKPWKDKLEEWKKILRYL